MMRTDSRNDSSTSVDEIVIVRGHPDTKSRPRTCNSSSRPSG